MQRREVILGALVSVLLISSVVWASHGALELYDSFAGMRFDPGKWKDLEEERIVRGGAAHLSIRQVGVGGEGQELEIADPASVETLQVRIQIKTVEAANFSSNDQLAAGLLGSFYRIDTQPGGEDDKTGDVHAELLVARRGADSTLRVGAAVIVCGEGEECEHPSVCFVDETSLGTVQTGARVTLTLDWNPGAGRFTFTRQGLAPITFTPSGTPCAPGPGLPAANVPEKGLQVRAIISSGPSADGFMRASFDQVKLFRAP